MITCGGGLTIQATRPMRVRMLDESELYGMRYVLRVKVYMFEHCLEVTKFVEQPSEKCSSDHVHSMLWHLS